MKVIIALLLCMSATTLIAQCVCSCHKRPMPLSSEPYNKTYTVIDGYIWESGEYDQINYIGNGCNWREVPTHITYDRRLGKVGRWPCLDPVQIRNTNSLKIKSNVRPHRG